MENVNNNVAGGESVELNCSTTDWENQTCSLTHEVWDGAKWVEEPLTNAQTQELMAEMFKPDSGALFQVPEGNSDGNL